MSDPSQLFRSFWQLIFRNWSGASAVLDPAERARSGQIESAPRRGVGGALKRSPKDHWAQFFFWHEGMPPPPPPQRPIETRPCRLHLGQIYQTTKACSKRLLQLSCAYLFFFYRFAVHQIVELWHSSVCVSARNFPEHARRTLGLFVGISRRSEWRVSFIALIFVPSFREPIDKEL